MLFKTLEKKTKQYREIINHMKLYHKGKHVTELKKLSKRIRVCSKNTTKKLIKLAQHGYLISLPGIKMQNEDKFLIMLCNQ